MHLVSASIVPGRSQQKIFAQRPETQQTDSEFALQPTRALRFQAPLDGVADVRRHIMKIRLAVGVLAHAIAVVLHAQVMLSLLLATGDDDRFRARINTILDQLGHRLEGVALRERNDGDRIPVIADAQIAAGARPAGLRYATSHAVLFSDPRVEAARATAFQIIRVARGNCEVMLQAGSRHQAFDDG